MISSSALASITQALAKIIHFSARRSRELARAFCKNSLRVGACY
jgi:hypothetical protein